MTTLKQPFVYFVLKSICQACISLYAQRHSYTVAAEFCAYVYGMFTPTVVSLAEYRYPSLAFISISGRCVGEADDTAWYWPEFGMCVRLRYVAVMMT